MSNTTIVKILADSKKNQLIEVSGWVKTFRANRFIALNDGSCLENIQCVIDFENTDDALLKRITTGSAIKIFGEIVESTGAQQAIEIQVKNIIILGDSNPEKYPIQPKKHSFEFLRENAHLRT
ncbi:MAG TPA: OB-fold nucleic acid binding domain-containing protein, partial [Flavobacteriaceae bacterium]|nr:OB-fold nucleic acid binding domain-containing protein [Flavobacteriaceae bacterium]